MRAEIIRLHLRLGKTMVYVTHDQIEAMTMSTRIAVLDGGRLQQLDTPAEVYARPATRFVAGFVGTPRMNFIPGALVAGEGGSLFRSTDGLIDVSLPGLRAGNMGVEAGIRPQDVILTDSGPAATVSLIESTGLESFVTLTAGTQDLVLRLDDSNGLRIGQTVHFGLRPGKLHLFDAGSGLRIALSDETAQ
ncbi:Maltose/maltodextrin import ATP-binding protein MalK [Marinibacterium anthonyi]|nr:Maltose/maltodextrin import ATP-binding protein MalK [Marinibacterium anthonyi]